MEYGYCGMELLRFRTNNIILCMFSVESTKSTNRYTETLSYVNADLIQKQIELGKAYIMHNALDTKQPLVAMLMVARTDTYPIDDQRRTLPITSTCIDDTLQQRSMWLNYALDDLHMQIPHKYTISLPEDFGQNLFGFKREELFIELNNWAKRNKRKLRIHVKYGDMLDD